MKLNNISLPYPVLGVSDDIIPGLPADCCSVKYEEDVQNYHFEITLKFDNDDISQLIAEEKAEYTCEVDCVKTIHRDCLVSPINTIKLTIPRKEVAGRVDFNCFVSVKKPIQNYRNNGFNEDYQGYSFNLEPGDILVGFPLFHFDADIKADKLQAAGSFMQIVEGPDNMEQTKFDFEHDLIEIILPKELFEIYRNGLGNKFAEIMHSSLAYNALTCALYEIHNLPKDLKWVRAISDRLHMEQDLNEFLIEDDDKVEVERVPELAMRLLKDPYNRMLYFLNDMDIENEE